MCYYITATLPDSAAFDDIREIGRRHAVGLKPSLNDAVQEQLLKDERQFLTTTGHCDCGTVLGSRRQERRRAKHRDSGIQRKAAKLRKDGWSESKVQRWLDQHSVIESRDDRVVAVHADRRRPEAAGWQEFVTETLLLGKARRVGLLLHWYRGFTDAERITLARRETIPLERITPDLFLDFEDDVLYSFTGEQEA